LNIVNGVSLSTLSTSATTFTPFPKLPAEIRQQIWQLALSVERFIDVAKAQENARLPPSLTSLEYKEHAPNIFFVCQESRIVAQRNYFPVRGNDPKSPTIYFNFERDTLVIGAYYRNDISEPILLDDFNKKIRRVAINATSLRSLCELAGTRVPFDKLRRFLEPMESLREILVFRDPRYIDVGGVQSITSFIKFRNQSQDVGISSLEQRIQGLSSGIEDTVTIMPLITQGYVAVSKPYRGYVCTHPPFVPQPPPKPVKIGHRRSTRLAATRRE